MTGGQPVDGVPTPSKISHQLYGEGVKRIAVVSDDPHKYKISENFANSVTFHHRNELTKIQKELKNWSGVTAIIYDQTCATEKRRRRKRGLMEDPNRRIFINHLVCEACGDCSVESNCISIEPYHTEYGTKRKVNQSTCNKDYSCSEGFCPSFVSIIDGEIKKKAKTNIILSDEYVSELPDPKKVNLDRPYNVIVAGIGGTGVVTIGALLGIAAHIENKGVSILDQVGVAQKGGAVLSHIRIANKSENIYSVNISRKEANFLLGCDMVVASSKAVRELINPSKTSAIINDHETPIADSVLNPDFSFNAKRTREVIKEYTLDAEFINASHIATIMFGDSIASNLFITGFAIQKGLIPINPNAMIKAIKLNNTFVEMNINAFNWGRVAAHDYQKLKNKISINNNRIENDGKKQIGLFDKRYDDLIKYQNLKYANRYKKIIEDVRRVDQKIKNNSEDMTNTIIKNLYKLMAYKDEYEVARLYTDGRFKEYIEESFEGKIKLNFHISPPIFSPTDPSTGYKKKITVNDKFIYLFKILKHFKFLRGSIWDPFGYTKERRLERKMILNYETLIKEIMSKLNTENSLQ